MQKYKEKFLDAQNILSKNFDNDMIIHYLLNEVIKHNFEYIYYVIDNDNIANTQLENFIVKVINKIPQESEFICKLLEAYNINKMFDQGRYMSMIICSNCSSIVLAKMLTTNIQYDEYSTCNIENNKLLDASEKTQYINTIRLIIATEDKSKNIFERRSERLIRGHFDDKNVKEELKEKSWDDEYENLLQIIFKYFGRSRDIIEFIIVKHIWYLVKERKKLDFIIYILQKKNLIEEIESKNSNTFSKEDIKTKETFKEINIEESLLKKKSIVDFIVGVIIYNPLGSNFIRKLLDLKILDTISDEEKFTITLNIFWRCREILFDKIIELKVKLTPYLIDCIRSNKVVSSELKVTWIKYLYKTIGVEKDLKDIFF